MEEVRPLGIATVRPLLRETAHVVFVQSQVVGGQHADPQAGAQRGVQEAAEDGLVL